MSHQGKMERIAIAAGKGGVGKSSVTVNLALALMGSGARVGILDADLYGPSIGKMIPAQDPLQEVEGWMIPAKGLGIYTISLAYFALGKQATIVRAPIANQIISELIHKVKWPELDFLLIDFPPGTGDIQLTLMQQASLSGAILVTTPQEVALLDVEKAYEMLRYMQVPILGVLENMSYYEQVDGRSYPFGQGGGRKLCDQYGLQLLGEIPLDPAISRCADRGESLFELYPNHGASLVFEQAAQALQLSLIKHKVNCEIKSFEVVWEGS